MTTNKKNNGAIIDVEEYGKAGKAVPESDSYMIKIDKEKFKVDVPELSVASILELAGKGPVDQFALYQKVKGGKPEKLDINAIINFRDPGIERFTTLPLDQREGDASIRQFQLPEEDTDFLESLGNRYELISVGADQRVIIYDIDIPAGYNVVRADVHFRIVTGYPDQQIDMSYFSPALSLTSGHPIKALTSHDFNGRQWQQWSRHRTPENPWRIGVDNLSTHFAVTMEWLASEAGRG